MRTFFAEPLSVECVWFGFGIFAQRPIYTMRSDKTLFTRLKATPKYTNGDRFFWWSLQKLPSFDKTYQARQNGQLFMCLGERERGKAQRVHHLGPVWCRKHWSGKITHKQKRIQLLYPDAHQEPVCRKTNRERQYWKQYHLRNTFSSFFSCGCTRKCAGKKMHKSNRNSALIHGSMDIARDLSSRSLGTVFQRSAFRAELWSLLWMWFAADFHTWRIVHFNRINWNKSPNFSSR